jgi:hypothetical protein
MEWHLRDITPALTVAQIMIIMNHRAPPGPAQGVPPPGLKMTRINEKRFLEEVVLINILIG